MFDSTWLARYPRPRVIGSDYGFEFKAKVRELHDNIGLKKKSSASWNPQSNIILECAQQVLGDYLRSFNQDNRELNPTDSFEEFLTAVAYAIQCAYHTTLGFSLAQLVVVSDRDMFMTVETPVDWERIKTRKQNSIHKNNAGENSKRIPHE